MKVVILAGGFGTRLAEESANKPKPMVEIGGLPILWHIMKHYYFYGFKDFLIAANFKNKSYLISEFFLSYSTRMNDIQISPFSGEYKFLSSRSEEWNISVIETGVNTETAGRVKRLEKYIDGDLFLATYGDGVSDIDLQDLLSYHKSHGKIATVCVTTPSTRFGCLTLNENNGVQQFQEKPFLNNQLINIGYFVFSTKVFEYIHDDRDSLAMLDRLAKDNQLIAYRHTGFWKCMDTLADMRALREIYESGNAPWEIWK